MRNTKSYFSATRGRARRRSARRRVNLHHRIHHHKKSGLFRRLRQLRLNDGWKLHLHRVVREVVHDAHVDKSAARRRFLQPLRKWATPAGLLASVE